ncbi:hypothetical protein GA0070603_2190 [Micromonospora chersina]|uniref:Uncharacterized protein n=1 Tax=Micromonospora chersina TaxID=47854 RepID=A0A1C6UQL2_9ACTN|nr:hypothetical protein GA0070603_2190 [Micromonospora chersina]
MARCARGSTPPMRTPWADRLPMGLEEEYGGLFQAGRERVPLARGAQPVEH